MILSVTEIGIVFLGVTCAAVLLQRRALPWILSAAAAFPTTAAINIGSNASVTPFYLVGSATLFSFWLTALRRRGSAQGAFRTFALLALVGIVVSVLSPQLFAGVPVLAPDIGIDAAVKTPTALAYTPGMRFQIVLLVINIAIAFVLANAAARSSRLPEAAFVCGIGLSAMSLLLPRASALIDSWFRNYPGAGYNAGETRHFGTFSEPSYLAAFALASSAYFGYRMFVGRGRARVWPGAWLALSLLNLAQSASGTAVVAGGALVVVVVTAAWLRGVHRNRRIPPAVALAPLVLACLALMPNPLTSYVIDLVSTKSASDSAVSRFAADIRALHVMLDTWGLGAGLGANRASSFATTLLSNVGVLGTLLFGVACVRLWRGVQFRSAPAVWLALLALLLAKIAAEPDLSTPLLWILIGVLGAGQVENGRAVETVAQLDHRGRASRPAQSWEDPTPVGHRTTWPIGDGRMRQ